MVICRYIVIQGEIGYRLGISLFYWVLTNTGKFMSQNTVQHMEENEIEKPDNHTSIRQLQREMEIHITNDEFKIDTEVFFPLFL